MRISKRFWENYAEVNVSGNIRMLRGVNGDLRGFRRLASEVESGLSGTRFSGCHRHALQGIQKDVDSERFVLAFVGDWNSGKSSLINRVVFGVGESEAVLPVRDEPTTSRITTVAFGEEPELFRLTVEADKPKEESLAKGEDLIRKALSERAAGPVGDDESEPYELLMRWRNELLADGFIVVDTPGLDDPDARRPRITEGYMHRTHAVVLVLDQHRPVTRHLIQFLHSSVLRNHLGKIFVVLNKIDRIVEPDGIKKSLEFAQKSLRKEMVASTSTAIRQIPDDHFFGVSATEGTGLEELCGSLEAFARTGRLDALRSTVVGRVSAVLAQIDSDIEIEKSAAKDSADEWQRRSDALARKRDLTRSQADNRLRAFEKALTDVAETATSEIDALFKREVESARDEGEKHRKRFMGWIWPPALAKPLNEFCNAQQARIERSVEDISFRTDRRCQEILAQTFYDLRSYLADWVSGAEVHLDPSRMEGVVGLAAAPEQIAAIGSATAIGVGTGVLVGGGAAGAAATTWVTTLPAWTGPVGAWLAQAGIFAKTVFNPAVYVSKLAPYCWPALPVLLIAEGYLLHRARKKLLSGFREYVEALEAFGTNLVRAVRDQTKNSHGKLREVLEGGCRRAIVEIEEKVKVCRDAAGAQRVSEDTRRVAAALGAWRQELTDLTNGADHGRP